MEGPEEIKIEIPYRFVPRPYQIPLFSALERGYKRVIAVYHRRAGKDKTLFNLIVTESMKRVGTYYYLFPQFSQARRVIWDGRDKSGMRFLDHIPKPYLKGLDKTNMKIELDNGSIIQLIGTDEYDKIRGSNPVGCVFSEYAFQDPAAWEDVVAPILLENGGWAVFNSTPLGKNHFYEMVQMAKNNKNWFVQIVTVNDSKDENGDRYITDEMIQSEREGGAAEEKIQREYYCSFDTASEMYYYSKHLIDMENEGRICHVPYDPAHLVNTWWDLGASKDGSADRTSIIFEQTIGRTINIIDYWEGVGSGADFYHREVMKKPYAFGKHNFPHDIVNTEWGLGRTRIEVVTELFGSDRVNTVPKAPFDDGINAARMYFPRLYIDKSKCEKLINCLRNYRRKFNKVTKEYDSPVHNWASHGSDVLRYLALGHVMPRSERHRQSRKQEAAMRNRLRRVKPGRTWMSA